MLTACCPTFSRRGNEHVYGIAKCRGRRNILTGVASAGNGDNPVGAARKRTHDHYLLLDVRAKGGKLLAVAFNDVVAEALEQYLAERPRLHPATDEPALFVSDRGNRLSIRTVQELVKRFGKLATIRTPVTPHVLRHSSATRLAELGTPLRVVQEICGHASVTTTERYVHVNGNERRRAIDALAVRWREQTRVRAGP